jgi:hypothetical protein
MPPVPKYNSFMKFFYRALPKNVDFAKSQKKVCFNNHINGYNKFKFCIAIKSIAHWTLRQKVIMGSSGNVHQLGLQLKRKLEWRLHKVRLFVILHHV